MKSNAALLTAFFRILFKKRRCDKTVKTSVVEAEKHRFGGFRISYASPHGSFVLEPDYVDIVKRLRLVSQPFFLPNLFFK